MRFDLFFFLFYLNQEEDRYKTPQKKEDDSEDSDGSSSGGSPRSNSSTNSAMDVGKVEEIVAKHSIGPTAGRKSKTNPGLRRSLRLTGAR